MVIDNRKFYKEVFSLALPVGFQMLINVLVGIIDSVMIGKLGEANISAVSVCTNYLWLSNAFVNGVSAGAVIIGAQIAGKKDTERIKRLFSFVIVLSFIVGSVFVGLATFIPEKIVAIYTNIETIREPAVIYLTTVKYTFYFNILSMSIVTILRAVRDVRIGLITTIFTCISNVFFNYALIYGHFGFPALGIKGAALATVIANGIQFAVIVVYLLFFEDTLKFKVKDFIPHASLADISQLAIVAAPLLVVQVMDTFVSSAQTMITGRISQYYIAANAIVHNSWTLPNVFTWGFSMACGIMIGECLGNKDFEKAKAYARKFLKITCVFAVISSASVQFTLPVISSFYNVEPETLLLAKQMGYSASFVVFFLCFSNTLNEGVFKSSGFTDRLMKLDLISNWLIAIPLGYICAFWLKLPAPIIYIILRSGQLVKASWGFKQYRNSTWLNTIE